MRQANGNQTHAAWLDISRDALRYKLKKFGVVHVEEEESGQDRRSRHRIFYSCCDSHRPMLWLGVGDYVAGTVVVRDKHSEEIRPDWNASPRGNSLHITYQQNSWWLWLRHKT